MVYVDFKNCRKKNQIYSIFSSDINNIDNCLYQGCEHIKMN